MILKGKNFQSWDNFSLDMSGLTIIVGPNDLGKSALFRSLYGIFRNDLSSSFIKLGSDGTDVSVQGYGKEVKAHRSLKSSTKYIIDGQAYSKLSGDIPSPVFDMGMGIIRIGDLSIDPLFANQHDPKFIIQGTSPSELNSILGAFSSTENLEIGKKASGKRILEINNESKILSIEVREAEERNEKRNAVLEESKPFVNEALSFIERVDESSMISVWSSGLLKIKDEIEGLKRLASIQVPDLEPVSRFIFTAENLVSLLDSRNRIGRLEFKLHSLNAGIQSPLPTDALKVSILGNGYLSISKRVTKLKSISSGLPDNPNVNAGIISYRINKYLTSLLGSRKTESSMSSFLDVIKEVEGKWKEAKRFYLAIKLMGEFSNSMTAKERMESDVKGITSQVEEVNGQISKLKETVTECPKCGYIIGGDE